MRKSMKGFILIIFLGFLIMGCSEKSTKTNTGKMYDYDWSTSKVEYLGLHSGMTQDEVSTYLGKPMGREHFYTLNHNSYRDDFKKNEDFNNKIFQEIHLWFTKDGILWCIKIDYPKYSLDGLRNSALEKALKKKFFGHEIDDTNMNVIMRDKEIGEGSIEDIREAWDKEDSL